MSGSGRRVVVIGGGVIGCASAWRLAQSGAQVVLLERDRPGVHASVAAAGMLSPLKEAEEPGPFLDFGLRSLECYPDFVAAVEAASGVDVGYRKDGRLDVALDEAQAERLRRQQTMQERAGYESSLLDPQAIRELEPAVTDGAVLGLLTEHDHQVDNERLMRALWLAAASAGVEVRTGATARSVEIRSGRVQGVGLRGGGMVPAEAVVVAAGAWSGELHLPRPLPVRPVRGQIVVLRSVPPVVDRTTWAPGGYLVPRRDGRLLVGATMEEAGFHIEVTAGAVLGLLSAASTVVPAVERAAIHGYQVGLRPGAPDSLPVVGPEPDVEGLVYATGHLRNGILLAPETAERVTRVVLDGDEGEPAFSPARFH